jgi:hypothetical protein
MGFRSPQLLAVEDSPCVPLPCRKPQASLGESGGIFVVWLDHVKPAIKNENIEKGLSCNLIDLTLLSEQ